MLFNPQFELTVYAPASVDPTESTPLTPVAGAPHSDPFIVTTLGRAGNMLSNPGFEEGAAGWTNPSGTIQYLTDPTKAHSGNGYLKLTQVGGAAVSVFSQWFATVPGEQFDYGGYAYRESGDKLVIIAIQAAEDANGTNAVQTHGGNIVGAGVWTAKNNRYTIPAGKYFVRVYLQCWTTSGTVDSIARFDDLFLRQVDQPYLDIPSARTGTIDPLNKRTSVGTLNVRILDARVTPGGINAERWVTAFLGDANGGNILNGRKARVRWKANPDDDWEDYWTGRIASQQLDGKQWVSLALRDLSKDLDADVFVGAPHANVADYAQIVQVAPVGLLQAYGPASYFPTTTPLRGTVTAFAAANFPIFTVTLDLSNGDISRTLITQGLGDALRASTVAPGSNVRRSGAPVLYTRPAGGGAWSAYQFVNLPEIVTSSITKLSGRPFQGGAAMPANGASVDCYIVVDGEPSESRPILVNDQNPIDYIADLAAGYFGRLDAAGAPIRAVPVNNDPAKPGNFVTAKTFSYLPWRTRVTKKAKLIDAIEEVCSAYPLVFYLNESGELCVVNISLRDTTAPAYTLTDDDLASPSGNLTWQQSADEAITAVMVQAIVERFIQNDELPPANAALPNPTRPTFYMDAIDSQFPDIAAGRIVETSADILVPIIGPRSGDVRPNTLKLEISGLRSAISADGKTYEPGPAGVTRMEAVRAHVENLAAEITGPYGLGPSKIEIACRRGSASARAIRQGMIVQLTLTALPDPASNVRGGSRLALCVGKTDDKSRISLKFVDAGANSVAVVPVLGALASIDENQQAGVSVPVTLNAAGESVRLRYAITPTTTAVQPAVDSDLWTTVKDAVTANGTVVIRGMLYGKRIWVQGRSQPTAGLGFKLPSSWASPAGPDFIDTPAIAAPSAVAVAGATTGELVASWTLGVTWASVEVLLVAGAAPGAWTDDNRVATLKPGSVECPIGELLTPGNQYTVGIRHRDVSLGVSNVASATFVAPAATVLDPPRNPDGFSRRGASRSVLGFSGLLGGDRIYGLAVIASEFPSFVEFAEAIETGIGTGVYGAYVTIGKVTSVPGNWTQYSRTAPNDKLRRKMKARHVRDDATASAYCAEVIVTPSADDALATYPVAAPTCSVTPVLSARTQSNETVQFDGAIGANDGGPLSWRYHIDDGAWSAPSTTALPVQLVVPRANFYTKQVTLEVTQGDGQIKSAISTVLSVLESLDTTTGHIKREIQFNDGKFSLVASNNTGLTADSNVAESGGKKINRTFAKALSSDPDNADSVLTGSIRRVPLTGATDASGNVNLAGSAWVNKNHDNLPDGSTYGRLAIVGRTQAFQRGPGHGQNVLFNPGFEDGGAFWRTPDAVYSYVTDSTKAHSGNRYLQISGPVGQSSSCPQKDESGADRWFEVNEGDVIQYGGWAYRESGDASCHFFIGAYDKDKANASFANTSVAPTGVWTLLTSEYTVPSGKKYLRILPQVDNNGSAVTTCRFDDLFIKILRPANDLLPGNLRSGMNESGGKAINRLYAKALSSDPDTTDALVDGTLKRTIPFTIIDASSRLLSAVDRSAKIGDQTASSVARRAGIFFSETFDDWSTTQSEFQLASGSPTISLQGGIGNATVGANCLKITGAAELVGRSAFQINPTKLYRLRARAKQSVDPSVGGSLLYLGLTQFRADGSVANDNFGRMYPVFFGETMTVAGGWVEHTSYLRGATRIYTDHAGAQSLDPRAPAAFNQDTVYAGVYMLANWAGGDGTLLVDYIQIDELDEEAADRLYHALDDGQTLNEGVHQSDGVTSRVIAKGHVGGTAKNGDTITFPINFQNPPLVLINGGINHEPRAKWGSLGDGTETGAYTTTAPSYDDVAALNLTASSFKVRARLRQKSVATARSANANTAANSLTAVGQTADATLNNAPLGAVSDQYTVHFKVAITCTNPAPVPPPGSDKTATVTVAIDTNDGSGWQQRAAFTYDSIASPNSSHTENFNNEAKLITVGGLITGNQIRIRIASLSATAGASASCAVHLFSTANGDAVAGLTYYTSAGDLYASKTPDADDAVNWEAIEVS